MDTSRIESKRLLRSLELKAFRCVVDALRAQGSLTLKKRQVLEHLANTLKIGNERCRSEIRRAVNDNLLSYIARSNDINFEENWNLESARRVPFMPMVANSSVFSALADNVSDAMKSQWRHHAQRNPNFTENMKNRVANVNSYNFQKANLFVPFLSTINSSLNDVTVELEKINPLRAPLLDNNLDHVRQCSSSSWDGDAFSPQETVESAINVPNNELDEVSHEEVASNAFSVKTQSNEKTFSSKRRSDLNFECNERIKRPKYSEVSTFRDDETCNFLDEIKNDSKVIEKDVCTDTNDSEISCTIDEMRTEEERMKNCMNSKASAVVERLGINELSSNNSRCVSTEYCESWDSHSSGDASSLINKDLITPHMFNLIPVSRRLKLVKKTEKSTGLIKTPPSSSLPLTPSVTPQPPCLQLDGDNRLSARIQKINLQKAASFSSISSNDRSLESDRVPDEGVSNTEPCNLSQSPLERIKLNDFDTKEANNIIILPMSSESKKTLSLLGNIKVRNLNERINDDTFDKCYSPCTDQGPNGQDDESSERISETFSDSENGYISLSEFTESIDETDPSDSDSIVYWNSDNDEDDENVYSNNIDEHCVDYIYADEESNQITPSETMKTSSYDEDDDCVSVYEIVSDDFSYKSCQNSGDENISSKKAFQKRIELTSTSLNDPNVHNGSGFVRVLHMNETSSHKLGRDEPLREKIASTFTTAAAVPEQIQNSVPVAEKCCSDLSTFVKPTRMRQRNTTEKTAISPDSTTVRADTVDCISLHPSEPVSSDDFDLQIQFTELSKPVDSVE